jgi:hypothetical protein
MLCTVQEQAMTSNNSITVNITGYCRFRGKVADHIPIATVGQTQENLETAALGTIAKKRGCGEEHKHLIRHCT